MNSGLSGLSALVVDSKVRFAFAVYILLPMVFFKSYRWPVALFPIGLPTLVLGSSGFLQPDKFANFAGQKKARHLYSDGF